MESKQVLNQLTPYKPGKQIEDVKKEYGLERIVKLASNENSYGCSSEVKDFLQKNIGGLHIYPDGYTTELRAALAAKEGVKENQLVFGSGSDEIIQMICRAFLYPEVNTVMAAPTFPQYKHNAVVEGAVTKEIPTKNGFHDLQAMLDAIDEKTNVVWLCSPNNPTGCAIPRDDLYAFLEKCPKNVLVVLDEAYYEYMDESADPALVKQLPKYQNLMILRTFSKAYGMAGLRVGYGIASENLIPKLDVVRGPFNTTSIGQKAALIALQDETFLADSIKQNAKVKKLFQQFLDSIGWDYFESHTNFLMVSTPISGHDIFQYLLEKGFIVRPGELLGCPKTIRITIGTEEDMNTLQQLLHQLHMKLNEE